MSRSTEFAVRTAHGAQPRHSCRISEAEPGVKGSPSGPAAGRRAAVPLTPGEAELRLATAGAARYGEGCLADVEAGWGADAEVPALDAAGCGADGVALPVRESHRRRFSRVESHVGSGSPGRE